MYTYFIDITSLFLVKGDILGTCKVRNEMKGVKPNKTKPIEMKQNQKSKETKPAKQNKQN